MLERDAVPDRRPVILDIDTELLQTKSLKEELLDVFGDVVECVRESVWGRRIAVSETDVIGRDHVELIRELGNEVAKHMGGARKTVQQHDRRRRLGTSFPVERFQAVYGGALELRHESTFREPVAPLQDQTLRHTGKTVNTGVIIFLAEGGVMVALAESEWKDGFLFIGNWPILDLLNTRPVLPEGPTELLSDSLALERWLISSGLVSSAAERAALRSWRGSREAEVFVKELIAFRERLRYTVVRLEDGRLPTEKFLSELNTLLLQHPTHALVYLQSGRLIRQTREPLSRPSDLWSLLAESTAQLLVEPDHSRLRQCEACVLHFLDTSKKGSRRWCSMNLCGNKLKVAAYQQRRRMP